MPNEPLPLSPRAPRARLGSSGFEKHPVPGSRPREAVAAPSSTMLDARTADAGRDVTAVRPGVGWALVVDDSASVGHAVQRVLSSWLPCEALTTPAQALTRHEERPGLVGVLVDLHLAEADGLRDVAQPLRARDPGIDIRLFTALAAEDTLARIKAPGFWYVLTGESREQLRALGPTWARLAALEVSGPCVGRTAAARCAAAGSGPRGSGGPLRRERPHPAVE